MTKPLHDIVMVGAGPSALAAAVYTTREDLDTVLYEKAVIGGMAGTTDHIDNYPGFAEGVAGLELADQLQKQAVRFGANIQYGEVTDIKDAGDHRVVVVDGQEVTTRAVLIATGTEYVKLGIPGEDEYYGRGVHYCATCDGAFYRDRPLVVVGGGNSAVQEAIFLTRFSSHIDLLVRSKIRASEVLQRDLEKYVSSGKITVHLETIPTEIVAEDGKVTGVKIEKQGGPSILSTDGVFVFIGLKPNTQFLANTSVALDEQNFIMTDDNYMTNIPGVFASGDVRSGATMQIASAVGEGATAALKMRVFLEESERS